MITNEQNKEITKYLLSKNLPIDLVLEVKDHMIEQIENMENVSFEEAFEQVKLSWKEELKMVFSFRLGFLHRITEFQNKIGGRINYQILKKSFLIIFLYFIFTFIIGKNNFKALETILVSTYYLCIIASFIIFLTHFKMVRKTFFMSLPKINIYQKGTNMFFIGALNIAMFNTYFFNNNKFLDSTFRLFSFEFSSKTIAETALNYGYLLMWIFGLFYFLAYKKSIKKLQKRVKLDL